MAFQKGRSGNPNGRTVGTVNRVTVELRALFGQLVNDPQYQRKLREDFRARRVHPLTEARVWEYHTGKPKTEVDVNLNLTARFELEAELLRGLDLAQLEALAAESQALIDRAVALANEGRRLPDIGVDTLDGKEGPETLGNSPGSDNKSYVNSADPTAQNSPSPDDATS